jgi:transposase
MFPDRGAEAGFDMTPWPSEKHFTSWLALCPGTKKSNGKVLSRKTKRCANRAAAALRIAAASLSRSKTALGAFYRRIRVRVGSAEAITATARKLAVLYYSLLKYGSAYVETGQAAYEHQYQQRRLHMRKANAQGSEELTLKGLANLRHLE